jgi:hypothetical protein
VAVNDHDASNGSHFLQRRKLSGFDKHASTVEYDEDENKPTSNVAKKCARTEENTKTYTAIVSALDQIKYTVQEAGKHKTVRTRNGLAKKAREL